MIPFTLIIPVFNEERSVEILVTKLREFLSLDFARQAQAILIDDGSTDGTRALLASLEDSLPAEIKIIRHGRNRGYGAALKTGVRAAANDVIAIMDADGTYPLDRLPDLLKSMESNNAAMVVGARSVKQQPAIRRPAKAILRGLAQYLTEENIPDLNSGFRVFRKEDALRLLPLLPNGFSFTTTITMALLTEGETVTFIPVKYRTRVGKSKIKPIRDTMGFLLLICRTTLAFNPLKVFGPVGIGLIAVGLVLLVLRMLLDNAFGVASTIFFLVGGIQILALGLLADLINRRGNNPK